jgi:polyisoprenoid-binding protein YceI
MLLIAGAVVLVVIIAGVLLAARLTNSPNQTHTAPGTAVATGTPIPTTGLQIFQIVPAQTTASYSVYENLVYENKPNNDAVGTTHFVEGNFGIRTSPSPQIASMTIKVDLRTLQTNSSMRDNYVRHRTLETDSYPYATFVSVGTQGLPASYSDGQTIHFQLTGNLTMHGKTNKEVFDVQGKVEGKTITGTATSTMYMTDFGIQPPNLANIAVSQNKVLVTLNFTAKE